MRLLKCVAFLNVLSLVTGGKKKNLLTDEFEVFKKINNKLKQNRSENYENFWDSIDNSFAKINLTLNIDPSSNVLDKYLNLCSLMQKVTWGNKIFIKKITEEESKNIANSYDLTQNGDCILLIDDTPKVEGVKEERELDFPFDDTNIISQVLNKFRVRGENYIVLTRKSVPIGSGLGGGSSDAAALLNRLFTNIKFGLVSIGSDIPFLASECNLASVFGIGDKMYEYYNKNLYSGWVYLLIPYESVSTESIYKKARELITSGKIPKCDFHNVIMNSVNFVDKINPSDDPNNFFKHYKVNNDLENCTTNRKVKKLQKALKRRFKRNKFSMSGSGSSFFVFSDNDSDVTALRDSYKDPLIIVKTKFKHDNNSHEFHYLYTTRYLYL
uniref:4-diphosphocytidyl-2c-methyl-D-erythritol kinase, putative n=1 Tax=Theileria annulata TaxID=5874 RepID=A0A3B0ML10_THEAN